MNRDSNITSVFTYSQLDWPMFLASTQSLACQSKRVGLRYWAIFAFHYMDVQFAGWREGYNNTHYQGPLSVTNLNHIGTRLKEQNKPRIGEGPSGGDTIRGLDRMRNIRYELKLERVLSRLGAKFRPQTSSWVFKVCW